VTGLAVGARATLHQSISQRCLEDRVVTVSTGHFPHGRFNTGMMQTGPTSIQKSIIVGAAVLAVTLLSFGPMFWMSQSALDRYIILCTSLPLSGVCFAWAWRERRRLMIRWAACSFAAAFSMWLFFLFYFLFVTQDEMRGSVLIAANFLTNGILFILLNHHARKKDHCDPLTEMAVM
jgi:hypothetical protein